MRTDSSAASVSSRRPSSLEVLFESTSVGFVVRINDSSTIAAFVATSSPPALGAKVCVGETESDSPEEIDDEPGCEDDATAALTVASSLAGVSAVNDEEGVGERVGLFDHGQARRDEGFFVLVFRIQKSAHS